MCNYFINLINKELLSLINFNFNSKYFISDASVKI